MTCSYILENKHLQTYKIEGLAYMLPDSHMKMCSIYFCMFLPFFFYWTEKDVEMPPKKLIWTTWQMAREATAPRLQYTTHIHKPTYPVSIFLHDFQ